MTRAWMQVAWLLAATALLPSAVLGQTVTDGNSRAATETARRLFQEGLELADGGEWDRAVQRFRGALELRDSAPIRFNLALSLERMGRLVEAIEELDLVLADDTADAELRASVVETRARLSGRLGHLTVRVRGAAPSNIVTVDGRPWQAIGREALADPGIRVVRLLEGAEVLDVEEADVPAQGSALVTLEGPGAQGGDDGWVWGLVAGLAAAAVGAAIVTAVVVTEPSNEPMTMGDFDPPFLRAD